MILHVVVLAAVACLVVNQAIATCVCPDEVPQCSHCLQGICIVCNKGYSTSREGCPSGTNYCVRCDTHCTAGCTSQGANKCDSTCAYGWGINLTDFTCGECDPHCEYGTCNYRGPEKCDSSCKTGYGLSADYQCIPCAANCAGGCYTEGPSKCDGPCKSGYILTAEKLCFGNETQTNTTTSSLNFYSTKASVASSTSRVRLEETGKPTQTAYTTQNESTAAKLGASSIIRSTPETTASAATVRPPSATSKSLSTGALAGVIVGCCAALLVVLIVVVLVILFTKRARRHSKNRQGAENPDNHLDDPTVFGNDYENPLDNPPANPGVPGHDYEILPDDTQESDVSRDEPHEYTTLGTDPSQMVTTEVPEQHQQHTRI